MKQILLVTDGCSNVGVSPVVAAAQAYAAGITVNVVGIVDQGDLVEFGTTEIEEIAKAGGGLSRLSIRASCPRRFRCSRAKPSCRRFSMRCTGS